MTATRGQVRLVGELTSSILCFAANRDNVKQNDRQTAEAIQILGGICFLLLQMPPVPDQKLNRAISACRSAEAGYNCPTTAFCV